MANAASREWLIANRLADRIARDPANAAKLIARKLAEHRECCVEYALRTTDPIATWDMEGADAAE